LLFGVGMRLVGSAVIRSCVCCIDKRQRGRRIGVGRGESFRRCVSSAPEASGEVNQWPAGAARRSLVQPAVGCVWLVLFLLASSQHPTNKCEPNFRM
jgi:hypothetical protein